MKPKLEQLVAARSKAVIAARSILSVHEESETRVIELDSSFRRLTKLPVDVAEYYRESLRALQVGCFRAAIVLSWSGFLYTLTEKLVTGYAQEIKRDYPKWRATTVTELLESVPEAQVLEAAKKVGLIGSQKLNIYKGWLSTRNHCAHPTLYQPSRNVALGFVDAVVSEVPEFL